MKEKVLWNDSLHLKAFYFAYLHNTKSIEENDCNACSVIKGFAVPALMPSANLWTLLGHCIWSVGRHINICKGNHGRVVFFKVSPCFITALSLCCPIAVVRKCLLTVVWRVAAGGHWAVYCLVCRQRPKIDVYSSDFMDCFYFVHFFPQTPHEQC